MAGERERGLLLLELGKELCSLSLFIQSLVSHCTFQKPFLLFFFNLLSFSHTILFFTKIIHFFFSNYIFFVCIM